MKLDQAKEYAAKAAALVERAQADCGQAFQRLDEIELANTKRLLSVFQKNRVCARHFAPSTGYGYGDLGRDVLGEIMAELMGCEAALVRPQIASGTHALAICLYGLLQPGEVLLCATGLPYDTMHEVIGLPGKGGRGSLAAYGVGYEQVDLLPDGAPDLAAIREAAKDPRVRVALIQRSRGYDWRPSLSLAAIEAIARTVHAANPRAIVMVDNCYGEFTDVREPGHVGADILAGSMIKNPGGGLAPTGGYIAGRRECVELAANRLTSPGIGAEVGSYAGGYQPFYQGLFLAPHATMQALRCAILAARAFEQLGYKVHPAYDQPRCDIIQAIQFGERAQLIAFIQAIQANSPVDAEAIPEPWSMPGYQDPVIMAAGTFVAGASIELSADAPIRPPFICYLQGGLTYAHGRCALEGALAQCLRMRGL